MGGLFHHSQDPVTIQAMSVLFAVNSMFLAHLVNFRQSLHLRSVQHSECQADHLQILATSGCGDISRFRSYIVNDSFLQPGDQEVCAFTNDFLLNT